MQWPTTTKMRIATAEVSQIRHAEGRKTRYGMKRMSYIINFTMDHDRRSQERAQQDSADMQQIEEQQPEIPKVGSRDAPGG
jgi:hypothetical protein